MDKKAIHLLGVRIHPLTLDALLERIVAAACGGQKALVMYVNAHALNMACEQPDFRGILNQADVVFCDGFGVKWGALLFNQRIPARFTPPDWLPRLCERCIEHDLSLYFLGARPGVAEKAAEMMIMRYPGLRIAGFRHGFFDKLSGSDENQAAVAAINAARPNILIIGFGMPVQEKWLVENWDGLDVNVAITAGAVFDYLSGEVYRVPRWMTDHGLEWLGRLLVEPRRLWKRYVLGNPLFIGRLVLQRLGILRFE